MASISSKIENTFLGITATTSGVIAAASYGVGFAAGVASIASIKMMIQFWPPVSQPIINSKGKFVETASSDKCEAFGSPLIPGKCSGPSQVGISVATLVAGVVFTKLAWTTFHAMNNRQPSPPVPKNVVPLTTEEVPSGRETRGFGKRH